MTVITYTASCLAAGFTVNVRANVDGVIASPGAPSLRQSLAPRL